MASAPDFSPASVVIDDGSLPPNPALTSLAATVPSAGSDGPMDADYAWSPEDRAERDARVERLRALNAAKEAAYPDEAYRAQIAAEKARHAERLAAITKAARDGRVILDPRRRLFPGGEASAIPVDGGEAFILSDHFIMVDGELVLDGDAYRRGEELRDRLETPEGQNAAFEGFGETIVPVPTSVVRQLNDLIPLLVRVRSGHAPEHDLATAKRLLETWVIGSSVGVQGAWDLQLETIFGTHPFRGGPCPRASETTKSASTVVRTATRRRTRNGGRPEILSSSTDRTCATMCAAS